MAGLVCLLMPYILHLLPKDVNTQLKNSLKPLLGIPLRRLLLKLNNKLSAATNYSWNPTRPPKTRHPA